MPKKDIYCGPNEGFFRADAFSNYMNELILSEKYKGSNLFSAEAKVVNESYAPESSVSIFREYQIAPGSMKLRYCFRSSFDEVVISISGNSHAHLMALEKTILQRADDFDFHFFPSKNNSKKVSSKKVAQKRTGLGKSSFVQQR